MQTKGIIRSVFSNTLVLEVDVVPDLEVGTVVDIIIKKFFKKRSKDANAYFHKLCDLLRQKLQISFNECKNMLITSYGQIEYIDDEIPATAISNVPPKIVCNYENPHYKLIMVDTNDWYHYRIYRGSHTYNSAEMNLLITGTIQECQLQGIVTDTPDQIAKMMQVWEKNYEKNKKRCM